MGLPEYRKDAPENPEARFQEDILGILHQIRPEDIDTERAYEELCRLLPLMDAEAMERLAPVICGVIPELAPALHFDQRSPHHAYDLYTHISKVVENTPPELPLRWAALLHDTGKIPTFTTDATGRGHFYGHDKAGAEIADGILRRLKAPEDLRQQVKLLIGLHMTRLGTDPEKLREWISRLGKETVRQLALLQQADMGSKGVEDDTANAYFTRFWEVFRELETEY